MIGFVLGVGNKDDWERICSGADVNECFFSVQSASSGSVSVREPLSEHHLAGQSGPDHFNTNLL